MIRTGMILAASMAFACVSACGQEFSRFIRCAGELAMPGNAQKVYTDFALRLNNNTAMIQRSNVLPVGERLVFTQTPGLYTMTYQLPATGTRVVALPGWFQNTILVLHPNLERLNKIRVSINRQSGSLEGLILNEAEQPLMTFFMQCEASNEDTSTAKF